MGIASHVGHLPTRIKLARAPAFFGWLVAFLRSMAAIGLDRDGEGIHHLLYAA
jgi:hypothetical protein